MYVMGLMADYLTKVKIVPVEVVGKFPACQSKTCIFTRECANHETAGDFRSEDGLTPDLKKLDNKSWVCSQNPINNHGAVLVDGTLYDFMAD